MQATTQSITALLIQAGAAHHIYEQTSLSGIYDEDWANWYADYLIQNGLSQLLGQKITADQVSQFLTQSYQAYQAENSGETWADYTAKRIKQLWMN